jgi:hypothetical protein
MRNTCLIDSAARNYIIAAIAANATATSGPNSKDTIGNRVNQAHNV